MMQNKNLNMRQFLTMMDRPEYFIPMCEVMSDEINIVCQEMQKEAGCPSGGCEYCPMARLLAKIEINMAKAVTMKACNKTSIRNADFGGRH